MDALAGFLQLPFSFLDVSLALSSFRPRFRLNKAMMVQEKRGESWRAEMGEQRRAGAAPESSAAGDRRRPRVRRLMSALLLSPAIPPPPAQATATSSCSLLRERPRHSNNRVQRKQVPARTGTRARCVSPGINSAVRAPACISSCSVLTPAPSPR